VKSSSSKTFKKSNVKTHSSGEAIEDVKIGLHSSESDSEDLFSISRSKVPINDDDFHNESNSMEEGGSNSDLDSGEEDLYEPNNFVMDRVIKVDGVDLPFEKLNKVYGETLIEVGKHNVVSTNITSFDQLGISSWLLSNIESKLHWTIPTHVQQMTIPALLAGRDLQVASPTGSGKTAAFLIPILQLLIIEKQQASQKKSKSQKSPNAKSSSKTSTSDSSEPTLPCLYPLNVVVAPTIELAKQIFHQALLLCDCEEASSVSVELLTKAQIQKRQEAISKDSLATIDLVITTPSRLIQLIESKSLDLSRVQHLVLDEVDRLMTDEMLGQADAILSASKDAVNRRIAFFSATIMPSVESLAATVLQNPIRAKVGAKNTSANHVTQHLVYVGSEEGKLLTLQRMLSSGQVRAPVLIFMQSKFRTGQLLQGLGVAPQGVAKVVTGGLSALGFSVDFITGDRSESQRREALLKFRSGETTVLVTTDLLARGLDFKAVATVINYDMPSSPTTYIHRIGRTGRVGGVTGEAWTLFTDSDVEHISAIANVMVRSGQANNIPQWILNRSASSSKGQKNSQGHRKSVIQREDVGGNVSASSISSHRPSKQKFFNPSKHANKESKTESKTSSSNSSSTHTHNKKKRHSNDKPNGGRESSSPNPKKRRAERSSDASSPPKKIFKR
jgi:ATP-dependent RNA helicase DDX52/ROK1